MVVSVKSRVVVSAVVALLVLAGCGGGGGAKKPSGASPSATAGGAATRGKALAGAHGCRSCHSLDGSAGVGPTWKGLAGSRVKLTGGKTVKADDAYLLTAIEAPDRQVVAGYKSGVMSAAIPPGSISRADAKALIAYIKTVR